MARAGSADLPDGESEIFFANRLDDSPRRASSPSRRRRRGSGEVLPGAEPFSVLIDSILHRQATLQSAKEPFPLLPVETGLRGDLAMVVGMPLGRYFVFVGSLLLAFLFLADRYMPKPVTAPAHADIDRSIIRLHSSHKWPERIVIDTSLPTIVPPPTTIPLRYRRPWPDRQKTLSHWRRRRQCRSCRKRFVRSAGREPREQPSGVSPVPIQSDTARHFQRAGDPGISCRNNR